VEIGGRRKLTTLCHLGNLKITCKRICKFCVSGVTSERLSKASSLRLEGFLFVRVWIQPFSHIALKSQAANFAGII